MRQATVLAVHVQQTAIYNLMVPPISHHAGFVGSNYYCESAYPDVDTICYTRMNIFFLIMIHYGMANYATMKIYTCCIGDGVNTPPWFSVVLSNSISDDIEVRICHDDSITDEDTPIELLEILILSINFNS